MAPCGKKTTSGRLLGYVIFFPRLTYVVNRGFRGAVEAPLRCADCTAGGLRGAGSPPLRGLGQRLGKFFFGPYIRLGKPTYGFRSMVLDAMVFRSMVLDAPHV